MLVIKRKQGEALLIGDNIEINIVSIESGSVKLAVSAPKSITILRKELYKEVEEENQNAISTDISVLKTLKKK